MGWAREGAFASDREAGMRNSGSVPLADREGQDRPSAGRAREGKES